MFTKFIFSTVFIQSLLVGIKGSNSGLLRRNNKSRAPSLPDPQITWQEPPVHPGFQLTQRRDRSLAGQTLTIVNNCDSDISHFRAQYNVEFGRHTDWVVQHQSTDSIPIKSGESHTIDGVTGPTIHFYGIHAEYDWSKKEWIYTEVVKTPKKSDIWTHVTFNNEVQFPFYMEDIGADMRVELCGENSVTPTTPATTTTEATTVATTTTTTTSTTGGPTTSENTLTIRNNCGEDITHFRAQYNVDFGTNTDWKLIYDSTGTVAIKAGSSITVPGVTGSDIHYYGLSAVYDRSIQETRVTEVSKAAQTSDIWTHVNFSTPQGTITFPFYMREIGENMVVDLC